MPLIVDDKWLKDYQARTGKGVHGAAVAGRPADPPPKRSKYGNVKIETEDGRFDSKHEAAVYEGLKLRARAGEIKAIGRQVTFYLPGGVKYVADFVVWDAGGGMQVLDAKSQATCKDKVYRLKKRLMMAEYGIEIKEV